MAQDVLADGFVRLCLDTSLNFYEGGCRVLVEGQMGASTCGVVADSLVKVQTSRDIDCQFGAGSVLAETLKKMFVQCGSGAVDIYAIPRADPAGAVAAVYTTTIVGPATSDGIVDLFLIDRDYSITVPVANGATAAVIATAIAAAVPPAFPYLAAAVGDTVTWTAKAGVLGEVGNYLSVIYGWAGRQNYNPTGVTITTAQTTVGTGGLDPALYTKTYEQLLGVCCYTCYALLSGSAPARTGFAAYLKTQWACDRPQCFGHGYTYSSGTLGVVLASATNSPALSIEAHSPASIANPWLKTGAYASLSCCSACASPELSIQGMTYGVLSSLRVPMTCTTGWSFQEQEELAARGFVVTGPLAAGAGSYTSPYIFNDVTNNLYDDLGRPNATFRDVNSRRLATATALAIATECQSYSALALFTKNTTIKQGTFGTNPKLMLANIRAWAKDNVGVLFSEFDNIDEDIRVLTDFSVAPECQGKPGKLHLQMTYRPPVRVGQINANLKPKLLDNCTR